MGVVEVVPFTSGWIAPICCIVTEANATKVVRDTIAIIYELRVALLRVQDKRSQIQSFERELD